MQSNSAVFGSSRLQSLVHLDSCLYLNITTTLLFSVIDIHILRILEVTIDEFTER